MSDETVIAFAGNVYFEHPISIHQHEGFLKAVQVLRNADAAFANLECNIGEYENWPAFGPGMGWAGTPMCAPPMMIDELKFLGIDAVYAANNHCADFAEGGILTTIANLKERGMGFAGLGANMSEASRPCYVETPNGRVALIAAADWGPRQLMELPFPWPAGYMPSDEAPPFKSRPGVNLVRYEVIVHVDQQAFDELHRISSQFSWERAKIVRRMGGGRTETLVGPTLLDYEVDTDTEFFFMGRKFVLDTEFRLETFAFKEDLDRIFDQVHEARLQADIVIVALHDQSHSRGVADFVDTLAHGAIDAGADIYINHGGMSRGIEIYNGKPILYGQSNFHLQNDQLTRIPSSIRRRMGLGADSTAVDFIEKRQQGQARAVAEGGVTSGPFDELYIQTVVFDRKGNFKEVRVYPMTEPPTEGPRSRKGVPVLLEPETEESAKAIQMLIDRCKPFGTAVDNVKGVGVVHT